MNTYSKKELKCGEVEEGAGSLGDMDTGLDTIAMIARKTCLRESNCEGV